MNHHHEDNTERKESKSATKDCQYLLGLSRKPAWAGAEGIFCILLSFLYLSTFSKDLLQITVLSWIIKTH